MKHSRLIVPLLVLASLAATSVAADKAASDDLPDIVSPNLNKLGQPQAAGGAGNDAVEQAVLDTEKLLQDDSQSVIYPAIVKEVLSENAAAGKPHRQGQRPQFVPTSNVDGVFVEQFTDDWLDRWVLSKAQAPPEDPTERRALVNKYKGKWAVEPAWSLPGLLGDKGLVVKSAKRFSAISAPFKETLDNTGKTLVVQYEVKLQNGLDCGGAYLKLVSQPDNLESPADLALDQFSDKTPYTIMFGPDKCVHNKIHFIFRHKNPRTGEFEEKHLKVSPMAILTRLSNLYTLIVRPDNSFEILINMEQVANGTLHDSFEPSVNPPKEIDDPKDKKPLDWVDAAKIPDPTAVKPADWDETAPYEIPDTDAKMPEDWLENEPEEVDDPAAAKPADWDDEEDGDWTAPKVANPKCKDVSGCGKWTPPTKLNPEYKGKWVAPLIANPAYVGPWSPRKIPNPDYFEDKHPSHFTKIGAVGFELWTIQDQIMFDNLYIGHSEEAARQFAKDSWAMKYAVELEAEKEMAADEIQFPPPPPLWRLPAWIGYHRMLAIHYIPRFLKHLRKAPIEAVTKYPTTSGFTVLIFLITITSVSNFLQLIINIVLGRRPGAVSPKPSEGASDASVATASTDSADGASTAVQANASSAEGLTQRAAAATTSE